MAIQRPTVGQGITRTPRTIALDKGLSNRKDESGLCTTCGVPENTPGHGGHYHGNVDDTRANASATGGPQILQAPFKLGG